MIRRPPRSTLDRSSAASDVYKRQATWGEPITTLGVAPTGSYAYKDGSVQKGSGKVYTLSLIHISEPTRPY